MKILVALFRILCSVLLVLLALALQHITRDMTVGDLWQQLTAHAGSDWQILAWAAGAALVLSLIRCLDIVWNVIFSLLTFLLMAYLVLIAAGAPDAALTPQLATLLDSAGYIKQVPDILWLIPVLWFISCLCARNQVAVFLTAVVCYLLWLLLTWLLSLGVDTWLSMGKPSPEMLADLFRGNSWLPAAITGTFLLVYALMMSIFEAFLRRKKATKTEKTTEPTEAQA